MLILFKLSSQNKIIRSIDECLGMDLKYFFPRIFFFFQLSLKYQSYPKLRIFNALNKNMLLSQLYWCVESIMDLHRVKVLVSNQYVSVRSLIAIIHHINIKISPTHHVKHTNYEGNPQFMIKIFYSFVVDRKITPNLWYHVLLFFFNQSPLMMSEK